MYLLFFIIGMVIAGFTYGTMTAIIIGGIIAIGIALFLHLLMKVMSDNSSKSVFEGCILFALIEGIFMGIGDI